MGLSKQSSGTDTHIYQWNARAASRVEPPKIMGHEFAAIVEQVGEDVSNLKEGDSIPGENSSVLQQLSRKSF